MHSGSYASARRGPVRVRGREKWPIFGTPPIKTISTSKLKEQRLNAN
jgi:hypothetical protein